MASEGKIPLGLMPGTKVLVKSLNRRGKIKSYSHGPEPVRLEDIRYEVEFDDHTVATFPWLDVTGA